MNKKNKPKTEFCGEHITKKEFQTMLNKMVPDERVYGLGKVRTEEITGKLLEHAEECTKRSEELGPLEMLLTPTEKDQETFKNNVALYKEWAELLNEGEKGVGEDYLGDGVAWWVASFHLKNLYLKKKVSNFYKNL